MSAEVFGWLFILAGFIIPVVVIAVEAKKKPGVGALGETNN